MVARPLITDDERRARLVTRHHLGRTAKDVLTAVRGVVAMHSSDPVTPHLGLWARVEGYETTQLDHALCEARTLWRMHAMRRTLFVVPTDEGAVFEGAAAREVARRERRKIEQWLAAELGAAGVGDWLTNVEARTLQALAERPDCRTQELTAAVPGLDTEITLGSGKWTARAPLSSRLLFLLAMEGHVVRTRPAGSWRSSHYRWSAASGWFPEDPHLRRLDAEAARVELGRRYLAAHGPATLADLKWWTGWTARQAAGVLAGLDARAVDLASRDEGWVLPEDLGPPEPAGTRVALLPGLDPTPMGWKERDWYLGGHGASLFDRNGNAGPTAWVDGRAVGGWGQRPDGEVVVRLLEDVGAEAAARVRDEAAALASWLDGVVVTPRFRVPLERELSAS